MRRQYSIALARSLRAPFRSISGASRDIPATGAEGESSTFTTLQGVPSSQLGPLNRDHDATMLSSDALHPWAQPPPDEDSGSSLPTPPAPAQPPLAPNATAAPAAVPLELTRRASSSLQLAARAPGDCSGVPAKPPLLQRVTGHQMSSKTKMLTVGEAQKRLARTILAHPYAGWAKRLYVPIEQLAADLQLLELKHFNPGKNVGQRCASEVTVHAACDVSGRLGGGAADKGAAGRLVAVKQVVFEADPWVITLKTTEGLPDLALAELCGLEGISGRPGCQRLLAWSLAQSETACADSGLSNFRLVLVSELCARGSLAQLLRRGKDDCGSGGGSSAGARPHVCEVVAALRQVAATLATLQVQAPCTVHCDLKPDNILLRADGVAEVIDWEGKVQFDEVDAPTASGRKPARDDHPTSMAKIHSRGFFCTASHAGPELLLPHLAAGTLPPCTRALRQWQALDGEARELLAPHWARTRPGCLPAAYATRKSDVYALGVMLAEALERCCFDGVLGDVEEEVRSLAVACCAAMPWERPSMLRASERLAALDQRLQL